MKLHIALVVQEGMKDLLHKPVRNYKAFLSDNYVISTKGTAAYLYEMTELSVNEVVHSGDEGGDIEVANKIVQGELDVLIFLLNPMINFPHGNDVAALIRVCNYKNILLATNVKTMTTLLAYLSHNRI